MLRRLAHSLANVVSRSLDIYDGRFGRFASRHLFFLDYNFGFGSLVGVANYY
jgi:hypothetical protein